MDAYFSVPGIWPPYASYILLDACSLATSLSFDIYYAWMIRGVNVSTITTYLRAHIRYNGINWLPMVVPPMSLESIHLTPLIRIEAS